MKATGKRIFTASLAVCMMASAPITVSASSQKQQAQDKKEEIQSNINNLDGEISGMESAKSSLEASIVELDNQLNALTTSINELNSQIEVKQGEIEVTRADLVVAKDEESKQYEDMKKRIRYMYENGNGAMVEMLLGAETLTDLLNKAEYVAKISEYDRNMFIKYQETKIQIANLETQLEQEEADLQTAKSEVEANQAEVTTTIANKSTEIANYQASISSAEWEKMAYQQDLNIQNQIIAKIQEQEERAAREAAEKAAAEKAAAEKAAADQAAAQQQAANNSQSNSSQSNSSQSNNSSQGTGNNSNNTISTPETSAPETSAPETSAPRTPSSGGLIWPCAGGYVSSEFGSRDAPLEGASNYHGGMDIAASIGTPIYAAASGTVILASEQWDTGKWIMIDHGGGMVTVYMHASELYVSAGTSVSAGQAIAAVGSTGQSTGPHLHFEVRINGNRVDPRGYLN